MDTGPSFGSVSRAGLSEMGWEQLLLRPWGCAPLGLTWAREWDMRTQAHTPPSLISPSYPLYISLYISLYIFFPWHWHLGSSPTWLGRKHQAPHHPKTLGAYSGPRNLFSLWSKGPRPPAHLSSPLPGPVMFLLGTRANTWAQSCSSKEILTWILVEARPVHPCSQKALGMGLCAQHRHCIKPSCPNGVLVTQSPEDSPCDTLV